MVVKAINLQQVENIPVREGMAKGIDEIVKYGVHRILTPLKMISLIGQVTSVGSIL
jgi:hypothetical protein